MNYNLVWDYDVNGWVYIDPLSPRIKYFPMTGFFNINHYTVGVIGGAYSVDKNYRLEHNMNWFEDEQLSVKELNKIIEDMSKRPIDLILTHTCPESWEPTDLFLPMVNQNFVDKTTERKLNILAREGHWEHWLWGHYHADREYPDGRRHMLMDNFKTLEEIVRE